MAEIERPDMENLPASVRAYIEALEAELAALKARRKVTPQSQREKPTPMSAQAETSPADLPEEPTTVSVITVSQAGVAKRTPRHLYIRQRRGGMGVFDLDTAGDDPPAFLLIADVNQSLVLLTDQGRAFRVPVHELPETPVRARGTSLVARFNLSPGEQLALAFPDPGAPYVALLTRRGYVLWFTGHLFGEKLLAGTVLYDVAKFSPPAAACGSRGDEDLFVATRSGLAIRFASRMVPARGCLGIRLGRDDEAVAIAAVREEDTLFLLGADGRGAMRMVSGFRANKSPGAAGKMAMKTKRLAGVVVADQEDDIFIISRLSKVIRFSAAELLPKAEAVQGVSCMALRADEAVAVAVSRTSRK
jgi:DNA gyrase subunit A